MIDAATATGGTGSRWSARRLTHLLVLIFVVGAGLRSVDVRRPVDGTVREAWREADMASMARNFHRHDMNPLRPRVDWGAPGPGLVESEFPLLPWLTAGLYRVFGPDERLGRVLSFVFSLGALAVFLALARRLLSPAGAVGGGLFFALAPLPVRLSDALQPDGPMLFFYVAAAFAFVRWVDHDTWSAWLAATISTALAVLLKASAAHIGVFFALWLWHRRGKTAFFRLRTWGMAAGALLPAVLWYRHAHVYWERFGNSLGISNEAHTIGPWILGDLAPVLGTLTTETFLVWTPAGLVLGVLAVAWKRKTDAVRAGLMWLGAVALFFVAAAGTAGDSWAVYYHVVAVPPAALLVGAGAAAGLERTPSRRATAGWAAAGAVVWGAAVAALIHAGIPLGFDSPRWLKAGILALPVLYAGALAAAALSGTSAAVGTRAQPEHRSGTPTGDDGIDGAGSVGALAGVALLCLPGTYLFEAHRTVADYHPDHMEPAHACAQKMAPHVPPGSTVLATGGVCRDPAGGPVAYNASHWFYWMDRRGANICRGCHSLDRVRDFARRGLDFFLAGKDAVRAVPGLEEALRDRYPVVESCPGHWLFDLRGDRSGDRPGGDRGGEPGEDRTDGAVPPTGTEAARSGR